jgi:hypothetical protein
MNSISILRWACLFFGPLLVTTTACGEVTFTEADDNVTVIRMTVTPAAEPQPALKHRLMIRDIDQTPGNAVPYYYRALLDVDRYAAAQRRKYGDEFDNWCTPGSDALPLGKLPLDKVRAAALSDESAIWQQIRTATSRRDCDWQLGIDELHGIDIISYLLGEFQQSRELTRLIALRTRIAIAERRYDDAIDNMRMNYRIGVDTARVPFLVCGLIGAAQAGITNATLTELIAAPDSPNMYWALTDLPQPLVDLRPAARFESDFGPRMFPIIHNAETTDHSRGEWNRLFTQAVRDLTLISNSHGSVPVDHEVAAGLVATGTALAGYTHAKDRLMEQGMDRQQLEKMPVGQVMAIYTELVYQRFADDSAKIWSVPYADVRQQINTIEQALNDARMLGPGKDREVLPIVSVLMPATQHVRAAQMRLERQFAALRTIEALRIFAAANQGQLPPSLDAVTQVPVPLNPATGNPFAYRLAGRTAILELPPSDGYHDGYRYEIQIANRQ